MLYMFAGNFLRLSTEYGFAYLALKFYHFYRLLQNYTKLESIRSFFNCGSSCRVFFLSSIIFFSEFVTFT